VTINRKTVVALAVAVVLPVLLAAQLPVGASPPTPAKSLGKELLPASFAKTTGFTAVVEKVTTSSKTGQKNCPNGAQEAFEDASGRTGVVSEVVACTSAQTAAALLQKVVASTTSSSLVPPKRLGASAYERNSGGSTYSIYWRRGATLELVGLTTDVSASTGSTSGTTTPAVPISSRQQTVLSNAAVKQDAQLK